MKTRAQISAFFMLLFLMVSIFFSLFGIPIPITDPLLNTFLSEIVVFIIPVLLFFFITKANPKEVFFIKPLSTANILIVVGFALFFQPLLMFLSAITSLFFTNAAAGYFNEFATLPSISLLLMTALIPAVFEEMYFRGLLFSGYKNVNIKTAALIVGFFFGIAHMNPQQFLYAFIMGTFFCYLVYKTGSIFSSILCHFMINAVQTILAVWSFKVSAPAEIEAVEEAAITFADFLPLLYLIIISLAPLLLLFLLFERENRADKNEDGILTEEYTDYHPSESVKEKVFCWPIIATVILYILFVVLFII